jgi:hypothetical protein
LPRGIQWLIVWLVAAALGLAIVWALFVPAADWLAHHDVGSAKGSLLATARDSARGRLLTLGAGVLAALALAFTGRTFYLSRQGQVTDRYTKAIEQLGSDKLDVRIGGIYALERIARDSPRDHPTIMEVLTAFVRDHSREQWPPTENGAEQPDRLTRPDVQAAITVIGRRTIRHDSQQISLAAANLTGANLASANLTGADLTFADLTGANLSGAHLSDADLSDADLTRAHLSDADLTGAYLIGADLTRANLTRADLTRAYFTVADLTRADLTRANLTRANLSGAHLTRANLTRADLSGADLTDADLTDVRWPDHAPIPDGWKLPVTGSLRLKRAATDSGPTEAN